MIELHQFFSLNTDSISKFNFYRVKTMTNLLDKFDWSLEIQRWYPFFHSLEKNTSFKRAFAYPIKFDILIRNFSSLSFLK